MVQKLVDLREGEGEQPLIKLPEDVVKFIRERPYQPPSFNAYICQRRPQHIILAIDIHSGVTPMFLGCKFDHCKSPSLSAGYPNHGQGPIPEHLRVKPLYLWYRPNEEEFRKEPPEVRGHVMQGGLIIRPAGKSLAEWEDEWYAS